MFASAPIKVVQAAFLLTLLCNEAYGDGDTQFNLNGFGNAAELSCGRKLSSISITWSRSKKRSTVTVINYHLPTKNHCYYTPIERPSDRERSYIICGDIAQIPDQICHPYRN